MEGEKLEEGERREENIKLQEGRNEISALTLRTPRSPIKGVQRASSALERTRNSPTSFSLRRI